MGQGNWSLTGEELSRDEHMADQMTTFVAPKPGPSRTPMSPLWARTASEAHRPTQQEEDLWYPPVKSSQLLSPGSQRAMAPPFLLAQQPPGSEMYPLLPPE